ncbi:hypothetical protein [Xanthocytophaga flavus]|uniref:hypothetical protein n=1 Tax=Xanthocytophaga flava TaxID=3048013 RepID=UPI00391FA7D7
MPSYCTVDALAVNHLTKEIYVFEESEYAGIGWAVVAGESALWEEQEKYFLAKGYRYTTTPNTVDNIFFSVLLSIVGFLIIIWLKRIRFGTKYKMIFKRI